MRRSERVIFLDFDGVLNHPGVYAEIERKYQNEKTWGQFTEAEWLDHALVARVGALALECDALVAVVSTWRQRHGRAALCQMLRGRGLPREVLVARCAPDCSKGEAVERFLRDREERGISVTSYVVVDDSPGPLPDPSRLVQTSGATGITLEDVARAKAILLEMSREG